MLLSAATFLLLLNLFWETQPVHPQASVFPVGTFLALPALWHFNGAGMGFPQRSCRAEARYVAEALTLGGTREARWNNPGADTTRRRIKKIFTMIGGLRPALT